jgi:hypothetical protein
MELVPSVIATALSAVPDTARVVLYQGRTALVGKPDTRDAQRTRWLATYDSQSARFVRTLPEAHDEVLAIVGKYIIEPDLTSAPPADRLGPTAQAQLFLRESMPFVVVHPNGFAGWRVFNLLDGTMTSSTETDALSFARWRIGVLGAGGVPLWVLQVK